MSNYARDFSDVTITAGSDTLQINSNDSNFAIAPGSRLFLNGFLPVTVTAGDTINRTLTLAVPWTHADQVNVPASLIPIGLGDWLLQALENNRAAYEAFVATIEGQEDPLTEVRWEDILAETLPEFVKRWASFDEISDKPEHVLGYPSFDKVTGKVSTDQLPDSIDTDNKRTQALSPPVKTSQSLTHILSDYPTLKKTVDIPTYSPNNRRELLFDDVRQRAYISLTEEWLAVPNIVATREFLVKPNSTRLYFDTTYTGSLTLRVYPMGNGGTGLPSPEDENGDPDLEPVVNFQWRTITATVTNLGQFASGFIGIIDYIETDNGFETLSSARSHLPSVGIYHGNSDGSVASNYFKTFSLRLDNYWYSDDVLPNTPYSIGSSWTQDSDDPRLFSVASADSGTDALRIFSDSWDDYEFEIVVITDISNPMALTVANNSETTTYFEGTYRFIIKQDRIYFKRQASFAPLTGSVKIESLRLRVNNYE